MKRSLGLQVSRMRLLGRIEQPQENGFPRDSDARVESAPIDTDAHQWDTAMCGMGILSVLTRTNIAKVHEPVIGSNAIDVIDLI